MKLKILIDLYFAEAKRAYKPGETIELPAAVAQHWIDTGAAEAIASPRQRRETAMLTPDPELR